MHIIGLAPIYIFLNLHCIPLKKIAFYSKHELLPCCYCCYQTPQIFFVIKVTVEVFHLLNLAQ